MYIELYILDNWLMDALILRLAACILGLAPKMLRISLYSGIGAVYALAALFFPILLHPIFKVLLCVILSLALAPRDIKTVLIYAAVTALSAFTAGGLSYALVFMTGGYSEGGVLYATAPLRVLLFAAFLIFLIPGLVRRIRRKRTLNTLEFPVVIEHDGKKMEYIGLLDTGNLLKEPISSLPGLVVFDAGLMKYVESEILTGSAFRVEELRGFLPDRVTIHGVPVAVYIYVSEKRVRKGEYSALIPLDALPQYYKKEMEEAECVKYSVGSWSSCCKRFLSRLSRSIKSFISAQAKRSRPR